MWSCSHVAGRHRSMRRPACELEVTEPHVVARALSAVRSALAASFGSRLPRTSASDNYRTRLDHLGSR